MDAIMMSTQFHFPFRQAKGAPFRTLHYNKDVRGPGFLLLPTHQNSHKTLQENMVIGH